MALVALNCPQCGAPLPRLALWRSARCASCGTWVARSESVVMRDTFHQAWLKARRAPDPRGGEILCGGMRYQLMNRLGVGEISEVFLARRQGAPPLMATVKMSTQPDAADRYAKEAEILRSLQASDPGDTGAFFSKLLPEVVAQGPVDDVHGKHALLLRHPHGYWGSLADLNHRHPNGLDPRHGVWIWRRMLTVLAFVHRQGWAHRDLRPEHAIIHPADHGVRLISWARARPGASSADQATDLMRSARVVQALLGGSGARRVDLTSTPAPLSELLENAATGSGFCESHRAEGLDERLRAAAREAFGPPAFVELKT